MLEKFRGPGWLFVTFTLKTVDEGVLITWLPKLSEAGVCVVE